MNVLKPLRLASLPLMAAFAFSPALLSPALAQVPPGPADAPPPEAQAAQPGTPVQGAWRATQLIGQTVTTALNQSVGTVSDIVIEPDGKVAAVLVTIGGFLGIGERSVPIALRHLVITAGDGSQISVQTSLSREAIDQAATHDPLASPLPPDQRLP
ncbi:MAG TPA: PRC-barrel domain-containing protein [Hyphomicrobium sp.]|nr:PRC-barrel domain-containing protein [Hyphomicrobium sp.]HRO49174.1 PRC-barrel domain-containing protein [Hyphomicrobium sp.]